MRITMIVVAFSFAASGCTTLGRTARTESSSAPAAVVVPARGPRALKDVPPGHYPPPGQCRVWYNGRPPGQQPKATRCDALVGKVPAGSFVLYNRQAWDSQYDWPRHAKQNPGSVPDAILRISVGTR